MPKLLLISFILMLLLGACAEPSPEDVKVAAKPVSQYIYEDIITIPTLDDRDLIYIIDRPDGELKVPIFLSIDGSSCVGQLRAKFKKSFRPSPDSPRAYARVAVEKPGVSHDAGHGSECSEEFLKYYTIEQRVIDHMRVLQHLKSTAKWWNGELLIWGWSDGGDIAAQLTAYYPNVTRAVLGAMGGGYTMEEHFKDFWVCPKERTGDKRAACIAKLDAQFQDMFDNPTWTKTWSGADNSWKVWPGRLHSRMVNVLQDNTTPILIVHGEKDFDSTPVASARKLVEDLKAAGNTAFTYWEIPNMEHGWSKLPKPQGQALEAAMLNWLLGTPIGPGGPPTFGANLP